MSGEADFTERLERLRAELALRGLSGFVVPRSDEHLGEYVAPWARRLAWLCGFTGSAGMAVVVATRAAIFTDGRYTLQVRDEVDTARFEPFHQVEMPPERWLAGVVGAGDRLGFDPRLQTCAQTAPLREACERMGASLVPVADNPIDAVWTDGRPPPPKAPVEIHDEALAGKSSLEKRAGIAAALAADGLDALVLTAPDSIAWLLNIRGGDIDHTPVALAFAIVAADGGVELFIDPDKLGPPVRAALGEGVRIAPVAALDAALDQLGRLGLRVRIDPAATSFHVAARLGAAGARLDRGADPCLIPKACKTPAEIAGAVAAHRRDGVAMARFLCWLDRFASGGGIDEQTAAARLERIRAEGAHYRGLSFPTISAVGPNGAVVHYQSSPRTNRALRPGQLYLVDSGAQYRDGTTDVTRTVAIGPAGAEPRRRFTLVLKGHIALARAVFPVGTTGSQLDVLARQPLWAEGLDYDHGTGHGVGSYLSVHEGPARISKLGNPIALRPGMVLSNEPGYYKAGAYGIRIESLVRVVDHPAPSGAEVALLGFDTLTLVPIDRALIDPAGLDLAEIVWLDAYHDRVRAEIAPLLDAETAEWLTRATRPLGDGPCP